MPSRGQLGLHKRQLPSDACLSEGAQIQHELVLLRRLSDDKHSHQMLLDDLLQNISKLRSAQVLEHSPILICPFDTEYHLQRTQVMPVSRHFKTLVNGGTQVNVGVALLLSPDGVQFVSHPIDIVDNLSGIGLGMYLGLENVIGLLWFFFRVGCDGLAVG